MDKNEHSFFDYVLNPLGNGRKTPNVLLNYEKLPCFFKQAPKNENNFSQISGINLQEKAKRHFRCSMKFEIMINCEFSWHNLIAKAILLPPSQREFPETLIINYRNVLTSTYPNDFSSANLARS